MLEGILAIAGQPGLFKLISQAKNNVIVESLETGKRMPVYTATKVSALEDIAIYTYSEEIPLAEVFSNIAKKENLGECPMNKKTPNADLKAYFSEILPEFDEERVYVSDIKKVFSWYNLLQKAEIVKILEPEEDKAEETKDA